MVGHPGWISKALCKVKEVRHRILPTLWFHLYEILEKTKLQRKKVVQRFTGGLPRWWMYEGFIRLSFLFLCILQIFFVELFLRKLLTWWEKAPSEYKKVYIHIFFTIIIYTYFFYHQLCPYSSSKTAMPYLLNLLSLPLQIDLGTEKTM